MTLTKKSIRIVLFTALLGITPLVVPHNNANATGIKEIRNTGKEYLVPSRKILLIKQASAVFLDPSNTAKKIAAVTPGQHLTAMGKMSNGKWYLVRKNGKTLGYIPISCLTAKEKTFVAQSSRVDQPVELSHEQEIPPASQCASVDRSLRSIEQKIGLERARNHFGSLERKWGLECPEEIAEFRERIQSIPAAAPAVTHAENTNQTQEDTIAQQLGIPDSASDQAAPSQEKQIFQDSYCETVAAAIVPMERTQKQLETIEQKWGTKCPEEIAEFRTSVQSALAALSTVVQEKNNVQESILEQEESLPDGTSELEAPSQENHISQQNACEAVATAIISLERTQKQLAIVEQKWGLECPEQISIFRKVVETAQADPLAITNIQEASFQELFTALQKTPEHDNAMLGKMLLPQKANTLGEISQLIETYPKLKAIVEEQAYAAVQTMTDAQLFLRLYPNSEKKEEVITLLLKLSQSAGPEKFLQTVHTFKSHTIPKDLQSWYLGTVTEREQLRELGDRFPEAKKAYVERSKTLTELFDAADLYPEHEPYVSDNAVKYIASKEDAKLFFGKYPDHSASDAIYKQLAEKALVEGRSSFKDFILFFPERPTPQTLTEKYLALAPDLPALIGDVKLFPKEAEQEYFKRVQTFSELLMALEVFPEKVEYISQQAASKVSSITEAHSYLSALKKQNSKKNPYEKEMFTTLLTGAKNNGRKEFTKVLQEFPKLRPGTQLTKWYVRTATNKKELDYAIKRLRPKDMNIAQLRQDMRTKAVIGKHKKIWDECVSNVMAGTTSVELTDCLKKITQDKIPTEYSRQANEIIQQLEVIADWNSRFFSHDPSILNRLLKILKRVDWLEEQTINHCPCFFGKRLFHSTARLRIEAKVNDFDFENNTLSLKVVKVTKAPGVSSDYEAYQEAMQILRNDPNLQVGATVQKRFSQIFNTFLWDVYKGKEKPSTKGWTEEQFDFISLFFATSMGNEDEIDTTYRLMAKRKNCYTGAFLYRILLEGIKDDVNNYSKWDAAATNVLNSCPQLPVPKM